MKYSDVILTPELEKQLYFEHLKIHSEICSFDPDPKLQEQLSLEYPESLDGVSRDIKSKWLQMILIIELENSFEHMYHCEMKEMILIPEPKQLIVQVP